MFPDPYFHRSMENALWKLLFYSMPCPVIISNREFQTLQCVTKEECENLCSKLYSACSGRGGKFQTHKMTCTGRKKKQARSLNQDLKSTLDACFTSQTGKSTISAQWASMLQANNLGQESSEMLCLQAHQDQDRSTALFCKTLWHFLVFSHQLEGADTKNEY